MTKKTFLISYTVYDINGVVIKTGEMRAKNKESEFVAKCSFEDFLKKKYANFNTLVIHKCTDETMNNLFGNIFDVDNSDIFSKFGDIFGDIFGGGFKGK